MALSGTAYVVFRCRLLPFVTAFLPPLKELLKLSLRLEFLPLLKMLKLLLFLVFLPLKKLVKLYSCRGVFVCRHAGNELYLQARSNKTLR